MGPVVVSRSSADAALLRRIAARDREAGAELFDRYAGDVLAYLRRQLGPQESEELLQEVFARALRRASAFRGQSSARTWLRAIARYAVYERYRDRFPAESLRPIAAPGPGPESLAIRGEARGRLLAALERLPDDQAIVLELHRVDGLTHRAIGRKLGISAAASRKRLERALAALARHLDSGNLGAARHELVESWRDSLLRRVIQEETR
jgi:RNA polymerase sigma-70 factor (ECF subfamily)